MYLYWAFLLFDCIDLTTTGFLSANKDYNDKKGDILKDTFTYDLLFKNKHTYFVQHLIF